MLIAESWQTYKSLLIQKYVVEEKRTFGEHAHIKGMDYEDFVNLKST